MSSFAFGTSFSKPASTVPSFSFGALSSSVASLTPSSLTVTKPLFSGTSGLSFGAPSTPSTSTTTATTSSTGFLSTPAAPASCFQFGAFGSPVFSFSTAATPPSTSSVFPAAMNSPFTLSSFGIAKTTESKVVPSASSALPQSGFSLRLTPSSTTTTALSFGAPNLTSSLSTSASTAVSNPSISNLAKPSQSSSFSLPAALSASASTTTASVSSPFGFILPKSSADASGLIASSSSSTSAPATSLSFGSAASTASAFGLSTVPGAPKAESTLTFRQLEDMVNKWTYELDEQERNFSSELSRLNKADCILIENAEKISALHSKVEACKTGQNRIEQELDFIESQQRELESLLEPLEQAATDLPPSQQHADVEREAIFQMCTNTDLELGQLLNDLRDMADQVNSINSDISHSGGGDVGDKRDPSSKAGSTNVIGQVTRILNSHMHSLSWLNQNTQELIERMKFINSP